jgi:hypothetical protein
MGDCCSVENEKKNELYSPTKIGTKYGQELQELSDFEDQAIPEYKSNAERETAKFASTE